MAKIRETSRSKVMSSIRRRDTKPEVLVRKELWKRGLKGYRIDATLPGRPDIYFPRFKLCIFIDGCFWHGCPMHFKGVSKNTDYWLPKIARNRQRDIEMNKKLGEMGFTVKRFWDHQIAIDAGKSVVDEIEAYFLTH